MDTLPSALIVGTGEYVSGVVNLEQSTSDKRIGVVALVLFDLKRRGFISNISLVGTDGTKFPHIREHFKQNIAGVYKDMDVSFASFPSDTTKDPKAYLTALDTLKEGDFVFIFVPDDMHFNIAKEAINRKLHVLVTKPIVKTLEHHQILADLAQKMNVLVSVEVHKRWDPIYVDAKQRVSTFGDFSYFYSYMSQPKQQLVTFKSWAGKSSDISYYLNSHHVDFHCWTMQGRGRPVSVTAHAASGVAVKEPISIDTEDTITLSVQWINNESFNTGTAIYTASWISPKSDVHSQQRFHYMGHKGEVQIDQAHRGYFCGTDTTYSSINPIYMKYTPDADGYFNGQNGYGYKAIEEFVVASSKLRNNKVSNPQHFNHTLATIWSTATSTAILEAGRRSLDNRSATIHIEYNPEGLPIGFK